MMRAQRQEALIELRGLSKSFREGERTHVVFEDVDARIGHGELAVLLGKSGSGKSTLLNLVSGIDNPTSGDVLVDGLIVNRLSERERTLFRRHRIGFVFQFFNLLPTLTVWENLLLPVELKEKVTETARARAQDLLETVGLPDRASSYPDRLSGGERQRVAIARALMHGPDLLLADEPTGNLDVDTGLAVIEMLDRLIRSEGKTMIMATHSPEVVGMADRIFSIEHASLVERTPANPGR